MDKDRLDRIERLKDQLGSTDYIAIKNSEWIDCSEYWDWKEERQQIRDEINRIQWLTDEEYAEEFAEE